MQGVFYLEQGDREEMKAGVICQQRATGLNTIVKRVGSESYVIKYSASTVWRGRMYCTYLCLCNALCLTLAFIDCKVQWYFIVPVCVASSR
jgi:hypothetical protein